MRCSRHVFLFVFTGVVSMNQGRFVVTGFTLSTVYRDCTYHKWATSSMPLNAHDYFVHGCLLCI